MKCRKYNLRCLQCCVELQCSHRDVPHDRVTFGINLKLNKKLSYTPIFVTQYYSGSR